MYRLISGLCLLTVLLGILFSGCTKDQAAQFIVPTNNGGGGNGGGGGGNSGGIPCNPDSVYFDADVLPILVSNCAKSGCHDEASHEKGIILNSYENVMATAGIDPYDLDGGHFYEAIADDDDDDRMPPKPNSPLTNDQVSIIARWIMQGAKDLHCPLHNPPGND